MTLCQARCLGVSGNQCKLYRFWTLSAHPQPAAAISQAHRDVGALRVHGDRLQLWPQHEIHVGLHARLAAAAKQHRRSLKNEAIICLEAGLGHLIVAYDCEFIAAAQQFGCRWSLSTAPL